jgi:WD40 repeat protein
MQPFSRRAAHRHRRPRQHCEGMRALFTGQALATLSGHTNRVMAAEFSPDGRHNVTASDDASVRVWSVSTGQLLPTLSAHSDAVEGASFSQDGQHIVTASKDKAARVWNIITGQLPEKTPSGGSCHYRKLPGGTWRAGRAGFSIILHSKMK